MSDLAYVQDRIRARSLDELADLGKRAGVPYETARKIARGYTKNPKAQTIEQLARALRRERRPRA